MANNTQLLFAAKTPEGTEKLELSLKQSLLVLIMHNELLAPIDKGLTDLIPYYHSEFDYYAEGDLLLPDPTLSALPLLDMLGRVISSLISLEDSNEPLTSKQDEEGNVIGLKLPPIPELSIRVDITGIPSEFCLITSDTNEDDGTNLTQSGTAYTFKMARNSIKGEGLTKAQIANFKLVDTIARKVATGGLGG